MQLAEMRTWKTTTRKRTDLEMTESDKWWVTATIAWSVKEYGGRKGC